MLFFDKKFMKVVVKFHFPLPSTFLKQTNKGKDWNEKMETLFEGTTEVFYKRERIGKEVCCQICTNLNILQDTNTFSVSMFVT